MNAIAARLAVALALAAALVLAVPGPAGACSCGIGDPALMLEHADAAFVGALVGSPVEVGDYEGDWPFRVEQWVKGGGESDVDVRSPLDGAACGFEVTRGARVGVFLDERAGVLSGGLCTTIDADVLLAAAMPIGPLDGEGPIALLVGGTIGPFHVVALDAQGRDLARAEGAEPVYELSVCPGSQFVAELAGRNTLAVRDLRTFEVAWQQVLPGQDRWYSAVQCVGTDGGEVLALGADQTGLRLDDGVVVRAGAAGTSVVAEGSWHEGELAGGVAVVVTGPGRQGVARVDLATGELTTLFALDAGEGFGDVAHLAVSPDGGRVAFRASTYHQDQSSSTLHVIDLATGDVASHPGAGIGTWLDDDTLVDDSGSQLEVLSTVDGGEIVQAGMRPWGNFSPRAVAGSTVYGSTWSGGAIGVVDRDADDVATLRVLPSIAVYALAAPLGAPAPVVAAEPEPPPTTSPPTTPTTLTPATTTSPPTTPTTVAPASPTPSPPDAVAAAPPNGSGRSVLSWLGLGALGAGVVGAAAAWAFRRRATS